MSHSSKPMDLAEPVTCLLPGTRLMIFGGVAELVAVDPHPHSAFPGGRMITIRPTNGGEAIGTLVPADFEPVTLPRKVDIP